MGCPYAVSYRNTLKRIKIDITLIRACLYVFVFRAALQVGVIMDILCSDSPKGQVGEQSDREEDGGDTTADVGDVGEDCGLEMIGYARSGDVLGEKNTKNMFYTLNNSKNKSLIVDKD